MIFLTTDVHHMSLGGVDQHFLRTTETAAALSFMETIDSLGLRSTMFISGRCVEEHPADIESLCQSPYLEIGGHNYTCFQPLIGYQIFGKITGLKNGPYWVQERDVRKTLALLRSIVREPVVSWRNHGYRGDRNTSFILAKNGIRFRSDLNDTNQTMPFNDDHVVTVPINTLPDHDYVDHGKIVENYARRRKWFVHMFRNASRREMTIESWMKDTLERCESILKAGGQATILLHPACMEVIDNFTVMRGFLSSLKENFGRTEWIRNAKTG